jgi:hypothetical protein
MPRLEFEPTILVFEGPKTFHALDRAATVIGCFGSSFINHPTIFRRVVW